MTVSRKQQIGANSDAKKLVAAQPVHYAAIIAGGASRRMGTPKALLEWQAKPLIRHIAQQLQSLFTEVLVVTADGAIAAAAGMPAISDVYPERGPLGGIHAALSHARVPVFCVACDMPFLCAEFIRYQCTQLGDCEVVVPQTARGVEPLHAIYTPACLPRLETLLQQQQVPALQKIVLNFHTCLIPEEIIRNYDPEMRLFMNWNTPGDVERS